MHATVSTYSPLKPSGFTTETLSTLYLNNINYAEPCGIIPETEPDGQETYITHFNHIGTTSYIYHCTHNLHTKLRYTTFN